MDNLHNIIVAKASEFTLMHKSCEITLAKISITRETDKILTFWRDTKSRRDVIVYYENKVFLLHNAFISLACWQNDMMSSCVVNFSNKQDISRETKIKHLLHGK